VRAVESEREVAVQRMSRVISRVAALAAIVGLAVAGSAAAHGTTPALLVGGNPDAGTGVKLRDCWMTVALAPPPTEALDEVLRPPFEVAEPFYGADALVGIWGLSCDRARFQDRRIKRVIVALVGIPTGVTADGLAPLANNFAHALLRIDTDTRALARALRDRGLPARRARDARFAHSSPDALPSRGELVVPGRYRIEVGASALDPTNPHDHVNRFDHRGRGSRVVSLGLSIDDAFDRFCFVATGDCAASVRAPRRSPLRELLGDGSPPVLGGFDHARIARVDLSWGRGAVR
jgi:hypothetical protein